MQKIDIENWNYNGTVVNLTTVNTAAGTTYWDEAATQYNTKYGVAPSEQQQARWAVILYKANERNEIRKNTTENTQALDDLLLG